jgi:hypothetical protein
MKGNEIKLKVAEAIRREIFAKNLVKSVGFAPLKPTKVN